MKKKNLGILDNNDGGLSFGQLENINEELILRISTSSSRLFFLVFVFVGGGGGVWVWGARGVWFELIWRFCASVNGNFECFKKCMYTGE